MITVGAFRKLVVGCFFVANAACGNAPEPEPELGVVTSNVEAGTPPDPSYTVILNDAVSGMGAGNPVTVTGTTADCPAGAQCFIAPPNPLPPSNVTPADNYFHDVYERPAGRGAGASTYYPGIDIVSAQAGLTQFWVYYRINLSGPPTGTSYAFEINYDNDLRGDAFVHLIRPSSGVSTSWSVVGLTVEDDQNNNMGGNNPIRAEGPGNGASYERTQFNQGANPSTVGGTTAAQYRLASNGTSIEFAIYRPFFDVLQGAVTVAAFRPYAANNEIRGGDLYIHDRDNRRGVGSPYPWLQLAGAPASCPQGSNGDTGTTASQIAALDSGTRIPTAFLNPCYAIAGTYEFDNAGTVSDFANKTSGELQFSCGDGTLNTGESCDDGNLTNGDGCDSNCRVTGCGNGIVTAGEVCDDNNLIDGDGCDINCRPTGCGNGNVTSPETCDDGNLVSGDGCDSNCTATACGNNVVTSGETCDDGNLVSGDGCDSNCRPTGCPNGVVTSPETCDDGNMVNGDGCDSNCTVAGCGNGVTVAPELCDDGNLFSGDGCDANCRPTGCGNGVITAGEACDDGNVFSDDGCDSNCTVTACGNSVITSGETCDDGNLLDDDGCDSNCTVTACGNGVTTGTEACDDGNGINGDGCDNNCTFPACGNGIRTGTEVCDDGNLTDGDGCDSNCRVTGCGNGIVTAGEVCDDANLVSGDGCDSNCTFTDCGNGVITSGEACDDGDLVSGDGCDSNCTVTACGNGVVAGAETCDDGNTTSGDGCDSNCTVAGCGNGVIVPPEVCDDSNTTSGDGCDGNCTVTACGNGIVTAGEACDDGDLVSDDGCDSNCTVTACGNGIVTAGEACDDGNLVSGDGCDSDCSATGCGNGIVTGTEVCDDGNVIDGDACDSNCTIPACGNGIVVGTEVCDDGNTTSGDGCDSNCLPTGCPNGIVTAGEACDDGNTNNTDSCTTLCQAPRCGDGFLQAGEQCDDGNMSDTDACRNTCVPNVCGDGFLRIGVEQCDDGNGIDTDFCRNNCYLPVCGDGTVQGSEQCDDGNAVTTDACAFCQSARCGDGFIRTGVEMCDDGNQINTDSCSNTCTAAMCGDGIVQAGEACDDGNTSNTDACRTTCVAATCGDGFVQAGVEACDDANTNNTDACTTTCAAARCGDGFVRAGVEVCDDGNVVVGDGCENTCLLTNGEMCTMPGQCDSGICNAGVCEPANVCGNGIREGTEVCDDGNLTNGDGCESTCLLSNGEMCTMGNQCASGNCDTTTNPGICEPAVGCGNGIRQAGEGCDDGNTANGDGCSAACEIENGFPCNQTPPGDVDDASCQSGVCDTTGGQPGTCEPANRCGNSVLEGTEICDDGNVINGDGCESTCKLSNGEMCTMDNQCQSGNCNPSSMTCEPAVGCGNGVLNAGEGCDDGDNTPGDGCNATCDIENTFPCNATAPGDIGNPSCESTVCDQSGGAPGTCEPMDTCGNNKLEAGEGCDDGGTVAGDGCNAACKIEDGDPCNANPAGATGDASCASNACDITGPAPGVCGGSDTDGDGVFDFDDIDDDNDGLLDVTEGGITTDTDGDGVPDSLDLDSDNDGIADATEVRHRFPDRNGDYVADCPGSVGTNGMCDALETTPDSGILDYNGDTFSDSAQADTDGDGVPDHRDLDSDNDGLSDLVEGDFQCVDANNNGVCDGPDADGDGISNSIDRKPAGFGNTGGGVALDFDSDGTEDYRDLDTDGDGLFDIIESKNKALDANIDGVIDAAGDRDLDGIQDVVDDSDLDGTPDSTDADPAVFGGLLDAQIDTDMDGNADQRDRDSDDDDVPDDTDNCVVIFNPGQPDIDGDGIGDVCDDSDDRWGLQGGGCGCGTTSQPASMAFLGLAVLWTIGRRRRRRSAGGLAAVLVLGILVIPATSHAQVTVAGDFSTERFQLATDSDGLLDVESAAVRKHLALDLGLWMGYANDPLTLNRPGANHERQGSLVSNQVGGELMATVGLFGKVQVGVAVPLVFMQDDDLSGGDPTMPVAPSSSFAVGDVRLIPKWQLLRQRDHEIDLAVLVALTLPTSSGEGFAGDTNVTAAPTIAISRNMGQGVRGGLNIGYRFLEKRMAFDLEVNDELFAGVGLGYSLEAMGGPPLELDVAFSMATAANDPFGAFNRNYAEIKAGVAYNVPGPLLLFAATGFGLAEGYGTPDWRMLAGVRFDRTPEDAPPPKPVLDTDGDTYLDPVDKCPTDPEDFDKFEDEDGCPDLDDDKDTIPDTADQCRLEPEDLDGFEDANGCPDLDNDNDKILDLADKCPLDPEDLDGFQDEDGCPELDNDADTLADTEDACPLIAGPIENKGCPWPDRDGDTVLDRFDNCPDEPGKVELQGCNAPQLVKITANKLELLDTVYFQTNRAVIQRRSYKLLDNVAAVIKSHPTLQIKIDGHTDDVGSDTFNLKLSKNRAEASVKYLVKKGVEVSRLTFEGFGEQYPIEENTSAKRRAKNRRVEFNIVGKVETMVPAPAPTVPATPAPAPASK